MAITGSTLIHRARGQARLAVAFTVAADGTLAATNVGAVFGRLVAVEYDAGDMDTGADLTLRDVATGATVFSLTDAGTADRHHRPTAVITTNAGVAVTAADTAPNVNRDIYLFGQLSLQIAQGGVSKSGKLILHTDEAA